jgi:hypothetical protein
MLIIREVFTAKPGQVAEEMAKYTEMYLTGRREIFQVVE